MVDNTIDGVSPHVNQSYVLPDRTKTLDLGPYEIDEGALELAQRMFKGVELNDIDRHLIYTMSTKASFSGKAVDLLIAYLQSRGASTELPKRTLMKVMSLSSDGAMSAIKSLKENPHVEVESGSGTKANRYRLLSPALWPNCVSGLALGKSTSIPEVVNDASGLPSSPLDPLRSAQQSTQRSAQQSTTIGSEGVGGGVVFVDLSPPTGVAKWKRALTQTTTTLERQNPDISNQNLTRADSNSAGELNVHNLHNRLITACNGALRRGLPALEMVTEPLKWMEAGADLEQDILPVLTIVSKQVEERQGPGSVKSWRYYEGQVMAAMRRRLEPIIKEVDRRSGIGYTEPTKEENDDFWARLELKIKEKENAKSNRPLHEAPKAIF